MKTKRLPQKLTIALGRYFLNKQLTNRQLVSRSMDASTGVTTENYKNGRSWNKEADLENISNVLPNGWSYQTCAGTFWIIPPSPKKVHYVISKDNWPLAEVKL